MTQDIDWLYDRLHRLTFQQGVRAWNGVEDRRHREALSVIRMRYRMQVRSARRIAIEKDFLRHAAEISRDVDKIRHWVNLARLPFPITWIEWDARERARIGGEVGSLLDPLDFSEIPQRMGILLREVDEQSGAWCGTCILDDDTAPLISTHSWLFAPEGTSHHALSAPRGMSLMQDVFGAALWPPVLAGVGMGFAAENESSLAFVSEPWIENRLSVALEPSWHVRMIAAAGRETSSPEYLARTANALQQALREEAGIMRFITTVLAMLAASTDVEQVTAPFGGHRFAGFQKIPPLGHNTVRINLPKSRPQVHLMGQLSKAAAERRRNRAHEVRGHFRTIERGKARVGRCAHVPTMVEDGVGICLRCERLVRWIPSHVRGDETLGWVDHDYVIDRGTP